MTATIVNNPEPVDVHDCRDNSLKALLILGGSLGLTVAKTKGAFLMKSPNATSAIPIPAANGLRSNRFKSVVAQVCRNVGDDYEPGPNLVDNICHKAHCPPERHRIIRQVVSEYWPDTIVAASTDLSEGAPEEQPTEAEVQEVVESVREPMAFIERPAMAHMSNGVMYESKAVVEREFPDGTKTLHCTICYKELSSVKAAGGHRRIHVMAGEAENLGETDYPRMEDAVGFDPLWVISDRERQVMEMKSTAYEQLPPLPDPDALSDEAIINTIRQLVAPDLMNQIRGYQDTVRELSEDLAATEDQLGLVEEERDQLRGNLDAVRDMLTELTQKEKGGG